MDVDGGFEVDPGEKLGIIEIRGESPYFKYTLFFCPDILVPPYINGSRKKQFEIAHLAPDEPRGFGDLWSLSLGLKIDVIRTCVCYY